MKKQIFYTVAGVFALFSMAHAQEPLDAANMKKARGAARASVLEMKNSKEFKEARAAQKAYWDAMKEISKKGQHPPPPSQSKVEAQKQQRDKTALKAEEKQLQSLKKKMDQANAALTRKMKAKKAEVSDGESFIN